MKRFLKKRWHSIPVGIITAVLLVCLIAGSAFAAYGFLTATLTVDVEEAIAVGMFDTWDNLEPYGAVDDVDITIGGDTITISTTSGKYVGEGFTAGEWIVLPVNIRNASDGSLTLGASVTIVARPGGGNLALEQIWQENPFPATSYGPEGQSLHREFKASGTWASLDGWTKTIAGNSGESGSAICGATVLFVKISAPGDVVPGTYTYTVTLTRE